MIALFMPCTTLTQITGANSNLSSIFVIAQDGADNDAVHNPTVNYLKAAHGNFARICILPRIWPPIFRS